MLDAGNAWLNDQNPGRYDVWSHGRRGHEAPESDEDTAVLLRETIGNWQPPGE